jgi:hypothetical protein
LKAATLTEDDFTAAQPIVANIPQVNVLIAGKYKVRAMVDSGSTVTMMSSGLFNKMSALKGMLKPTTLGFYGVGDNKRKYEGILYELGL